MGAVASLGIFATIDAFHRLHVGGYSDGKINMRSRVTLLSAGHMAHMTEEYECV